MIFNFTDGKDCTMDVSVINPVSDSCITNASMSQKSSIEKSEYNKNHKYLADCERLNIGFKPVIWEIFGMPSDYFCELFSILVKQISHISKIEVSIIHSFWQKKFSFTLQLYNARLLNNACMHILDKNANDYSRSDLNNQVLEDNSMLEDN